MKLSPKHLSHTQLVVGGSLLVLVIVGTAGWQFYRLHQYTKELREELHLLREDQKATAASLSSTLAILNENLSLTKEEQEKLRFVLNTEQERAKAQAQRLENISGTVGTLEKLTYTDKELLQKYSKIYFLNEHYIPSNLSRIPDNYIHSSKADLQIHRSVLPFLEKMMSANPDPDFDLRILSAYRSFGTQAGLKSNYTVTYGAGTANQFSADQGYSEHQLGTTVDFTTVRTGIDLGSFQETSDYRWLLQNAYKYGFALSYPPNNSYYQFEPWHWRFVGVELATKLHTEGKYFYDLDQREIDKHLISIFDPIK